MDRDYFTDHTFQPAMINILSDWKGVSSIIPEVNGSVDTSIAKLSNLQYNYHELLCL